MVECARPNMKWIVAFLLVLAGALAASAQESRITAVVNTDVITIGDLSARLKLVMASSNIPDTPENRQRLSAQVLRSLIDEKLELQEAKRLGVSASKEEVDGSLASIEQRNNMPKGGLDAYLEQRGIPKGTLLDQISAALAFSKVVRNRVSQDVSVSEDEVNEAMKRLQADIGKPQSRVAEIFLSIDNPSQEDEVKRLADRLIDQIRGGANFSAVAQQFSQSPSAAVGGDIGWVFPSELSPLLAEALTKMKPGEMSYPVRTPAGIYILYLMDRRTIGAADPAQIVLSLDEVVFAVPADAPAAERQRIEAEAQQVSAAAKSCDELAKIGQERAPQLSRRVPEMRASELPPQLRQQILALKLSEASQPIAFPGGIGVVMVCDRHDPAGMPSRDDVTDTIARERYDTLARRYLRDLRRGAYVDIRG
jgi:peptidyl-prolyl cis-trans isomerase SurA